MLPPRGQTTNRPPLSRPNLVIETRPASINPHELSLLVAACHAATPPPPLQQPPLPPSPQPDRYAKVLRNTPRLVAIYANRTDAPSDFDTLLDSYYRSNEPSTSSSNASTFFTLPFPSPWRAQSKRLVGFARVAGDRSMVATLYDVVVHPDFRNRGLGRFMVDRLCQAMMLEDCIIDIGVAAPVESAVFFERVGFGPDKLGSTFMRYEGGGEASILSPSLATVMKRACVGKKK